MKLPIYILCFNNGWQVKHTVEQLSRFNQDLFIIDNASDSQRTKRHLAQLEGKNRCRVIRMPENYGHRVLWRDEFYSQLPQYFAFTDPDLAYPSSLPDNFLDVLAELTTRFNVRKAGLALEIPSADQTYSDLYCEGKTIRDWESKFWNDRLEHPDLEVYLAEIDTTFAVYNKNIANERCCRVAGHYTARHLPWYIDYNTRVSPVDTMEAYGKAQCSTIARIIVKHFHNPHPNVEVVWKNRLPILVEFDGSEAREGFWKNHYSNWESDSFAVFDRYAKEDNVVIDIGSWIGPTVLYLAKKCKRVITVEADLQACEVLERNIGYNELDNVEIISKAIYCNNSGVMFGPNAFTHDGLNASTSQIVPEGGNNGDSNYFIPSVTWSDVAAHLHPREKVCLIKVDIEGGEEFILRDVLKWAYAHRVPAYISFHHCWWQDKGLDRFQDVFDLFGIAGLKEQIQANPLISIVFERKRSLIFRGLRFLRRRLASLCKLRKNRNRVSVS